MFLVKLKECELRATLHNFGAYFLVLTSAPVNICIMCTHIQSKSDYPDICYAQLCMQRCRYVMRSQGCAEYQNQFILMDLELSSPVKMLQGIN